MRDAAVVIRTEDGRIELVQTREVAPGEAIVGAGTAGLAGVLFGFAVGGGLVGLVGGGVFGLRDAGSPRAG